MRNWRHDTNEHKKHHKWWIFLMDIAYDAQESLHGVPDWLA
jgi:hypothetical protein